MTGEQAAVGESDDAEQPVLSRRERARAATIEEIKQTALRLMREQGTTAVHFSEIARVMGMTAPALYRYFADRDELLTALIVDAFDDLGGQVAKARDEVPQDDPSGRLRAVAEAYRRWARQEPEQFALILGMPVPGYAAPEEGPTTEAAKRAMAQLKALFYDAAARGVLGRPMLPEVTDVVRTFCAENPKGGEPVDDDHEVPPETFQAMLYCWSAIHGFASLEAYGHLTWLPPEVCDAIFGASMRAVAVAAGLPAPAKALLPAEAGDQPAGPAVGSP